MKIESIDIITPAFGKSSTKIPVLCRINTDEGIYGYGEAGVSIAKASLGCIPLLQTFGRIILGKNPLENDVIYRLLANTFWAKGNGGVIMAAISAIDVALWDIKGKAFGVPVYVLLGGKQRDRLRTYASQLQYGWRDPLFINAPGDPSFLREACHKAMEDGFDCVKIDFLGKHKDGTPISSDEKLNHLTLRTLHEIEEKMIAVRDVIGPDTELLIDNQCMTTAKTAIEFANVAMNYSPSLLEEPANPLDIMDYKKLHESLPVSLATGEHSYTRRGVSHLLKERLIDVVQPDLGNCGGITEGRKITDLAENFGIIAQAHTCNTPISVAASLQFEAAIPNFYMHELHTSNTLDETTELCIYNDQPVNGYYSIPDRPGIGNELTEKALKEAEIITVR